jgi:hypothetical protein
MIPSGKSSKWFVPASALIGLLWISGALAQESTGGATPTLGEVARHQRQQPKTAKLVVGDDDIPSSHTHRITGMAGTTKMIPYITFTGLVPDVITVSTVLDPKQKIHVRFGPQAVESCYDLDCAETTYLQTFPKTFGGTVRILFDTNETIQNYQARVAHIEIIHDVLGKLTGSVVFVRAPVVVVTATCIYRAEDRSDAESDCNTYIESLQINVPAKYIDAQGNR